MLWKRRSRARSGARLRLLCLVGAALGASGLFASPAGATWAVYYQANLAANTWYDTPGYWSYTQNSVDGVEGVWYAARFRNSAGTTLSSASGISSIAIYYYGGSYVSPGCKNYGPGSVFTSCWAWY